MARKIVNRKALREEVEAAEAAGTPKKKVAKRKTAKRKKKKEPSEIRLKAFWGVFSQSMKQVAIFEYHEKKEAQKKAATLSQSGKSPHFVKKVKQEIEES